MKDSMKIIMGMIFMWLNFFTLFTETKYYDVSLFNNTSQDLFIKIYLTPERGGTISYTGIASQQTKKAYFSDHTPAITVVGNDLSIDLPIDRDIKHIELNDEIFDILPRP